MGLFFYVGCFLVGMGFGLVLGIFASYSGDKTCPVKVGCFFVFRLELFGWYAGRVSSDCVVG